MEETVKIVLNIKYDTYIDIRRKRGGKIEFESPKIEIDINKINDMIEEVIGCLPKGEITANVNIDLSKLQEME